MSNYIKYFNFPDQSYQVLQNVETKRNKPNQFNEREGVVFPMSEWDMFQSTISLDALITPRKQPNIGK